MSLSESGVQTAKPLVFTRPVPVPEQPLPSAFYRLAWSNLTAQFAEQIALAAAPLVAVLVLGAGAGATGLLQTAQTLPFLLLSLPAGVLVDRASRRQLMTGAELLRALSLLGVLGLLVFAKLDLLLLALLGFVAATGTVVYNVAAPALVPGLVPRPLLASANRWLELARSTAFTAGPVLGGALVGWTGAPVAYAVATTLSLLAATLLARLPEPARLPAPIQHPMLALKEGAAFVFGHVLLRPILLTAVVFNTSWFVLQAIYVVYAVDHLRMTATEVGLTLGVYGVGMIAGAVSAPKIGRLLPLGLTIAVGPLSAVVASFVLLLTIWAPSVVLAAISFFLFGAGPIVWTITTTTLRQQLTPDAMLGRVSALLMTATYGARPIGAAIGALVAVTVGLNACLIVVALGFTIQFLILAVSPVRGLRDLSGIDRHVAINE